MTYLVEWKPPADMHDPGGDYCRQINQEMSRAWMDALARPSRFRALFHASPGEVKITPVPTKPRRRRLHAR